MDSLEPLLETLRRYQLLTSRQLGDLDDVARDFASAEGLLRELEQREWLTAYQSRYLRRGQGERLVVGPYVVLEPLGGGAMGQVFRARHRLLERVAALKRIRRDHEDNPRMAERFLREVRAAASLAHANIVSVYDFYLDGDEFYLAMELIPGADLHSYLDRHGPLPIALACEYAHQACRGLQHAHGRGVIHRDIKPRNLLLSAAGQVKIIDFGLARRESDPTLTASQVMMGTLDYVAPEQADDAHAVDGRADIYSLGCTLYHLLAGHTPFAHVPPEERLQAHRTRQPPRIENVRPDVPKPLATLLRRMMERRFEDRFQRAAEVAEALEFATATLRTEPRRLEIGFPGAWLARPENEPQAKWRPILSTPATVTIRPEEVYYLMVGSDATAAQLAGLANLKGLTALQSLSLTLCARLTDEILAPLRGLTGLRSLYLSSCEQLSDDGLAHLAGLTALQILDLSFCQAITNNGLSHLRGLTALHTLDLGGCVQLDNAGLSFLRGFSALQSLNLSRCERVTDEVLEALQGLTSLRGLTLNQCHRLTDAGLTYLHPLTSLEVLYLAGCTQLTSAGLKQLENALPRCEILVS
jgi:serine/threonine-protein kinase